MTDKPGKVAKRSACDQWARAKKQDDRKKFCSWM